MDTRDYVSCALVRCNSIHRGLLGVIMCLDVINVPVRTCSLLSLLMLLLLARLFSPFLFSLFSLSFLSAACQNSLKNRPREIDQTISVSVNIQYLSVQQTTNRRTGTSMMWPNLAFLILFFYFKNAGNRTPWVIFFF